MVNKQSSLIFIFSLLSHSVQADAHLEKLQEQISHLYSQRSELLETLEQLKYSELSLEDVKERTLKDIEEQKKDSLAMEQAYQQKINQAVYWHYNQSKFLLQQLKSQNNLSLDGTSLCQYMTDKSREDFKTLQKQLKILETSYLDLHSQELKLSSLKANHLELLSKLDEEEKFLKQYIQEHQREIEQAEKDRVEQSLQINPFDIDELSEPLALMHQRERHDFLGAQIFQAELGEAIYAIADGTVIFSDTLKGLGNMAIVEHTDGFMSLYANCQTLHVSQGDRVKQDSTIGSVGQSGQIGQQALYFELRQKGQIIPSPQSWSALS